METILLEYAWVLVLLVFLEGILAADNAIVMAVMVKHLPEEKRKKALFYGLVGALVFRFAALFLIVFLANFWQIQALGAFYLFFICIKHFIDKRKIDENEEEEAEEDVEIKDDFWWTVLKVEFADIAFAIDSMLAAIAVAITLKPIGDIELAGMNIGPFMVMFLGGIIGVVIMRFAATYLVGLLERKPGLEDAAFLIVGWVGVKLAVIVLCHEKVGILPSDFAHSLAWKVIFFGVMIALILVGWFRKTPKKKA